MLIGIPILNRLDLLKECLQSIDYPAEVLIINNNTVDGNFCGELSLLARQRRFTVLHQERNLGVSASWNLILRTGLSRGHEWVCIGSNDTVLNPGSLKAALTLKKEDDFGIWHLHAFNFFLMRKSTIDAVGWFDENFYPAYKEDQDYSYRCELAAVKRLPGIPNCGANHFGSATIRSNAEYARRNQITQRWNSQYYKRKWGGEVGQETLRRPFNHPGVDHRWWPKLETRSWACDWDAEARLHHFFAAEGSFAPPAIP